MMWANVPKGVIRGIIYHIGSVGKKFPINRYSCIIGGNDAKDIKFKEFKHSNLTIHVFNEQIDTDGHPCSVQPHTCEGMDVFVHQLKYIPNQLIYLPHLC